MCHYRGSYVSEDRAKAELIVSGSLRLNAPRLSIR